jgi:hypothetical protein
MRTSGPTLGSFSELSVINAQPLALAQNITLVVRAVLRGEYWY